MPQLPVAQKALGQHWLEDQASLEAITDAAQVVSGDHVLEIGPGSGTLTRELLTHGAHVVAVEYDKALADSLASRLEDVLTQVPGQEAQLVVTHADIRRFDLGSLPPGYKLVANIPYYLTAHLLRLLTETNNPPFRTALLVQKEVAVRVAARPGDMSFISVAVQLFYHVSLGPVVPARLFTPVPKVDSQILILKSRSKPLFHDIDNRAFFRVVKAGFANRRKTLLNALGAGLHIDRATTEKLLEKAGIDQSARAQELGLDEWFDLYRSTIILQTKNL